MRLCLLTKSLRAIDGQSEWVFDNGTIGNWTIGQG